jgi:hypothetical protein
MIWGNYGMGLSFVIPIRTGMSLLLFFFALFILFPFRSPPSFSLSREWRWRWS